jgi:hypothetical protein
MRIGRLWVARILCALSSVAFVACSSQRATYLADGAKGYVITCKGYLNNWESCLIKAGKICRTRGYDTIRSEEYDRYLLIACKTTTAK